MRSFSSSAKLRSRPQGFSLIELMVVLGIMAALATMTFPAMSLFSSFGFSNTTDQIGETLKLARSTALAQNTYVWVGFNIQQQGSQSQLVVATVYSLSGENDLSAGNLHSLLKPFKRTDVQVNFAPSTEQGVDNLGTGNLSFTQTINGESTPRTFTSVIQYSPLGEASIKDTSISKMIQFQLQPLQGSTANSHNLALIQINGINGSADIHR